MLPRSGNVISLEATACSVSGTKTAAGDGVNAGVDVDADIGVDVGSSSEWVVASVDEVAWSGVVSAMYAALVIAAAEDVDFEVAVDRPINADGFVAEVPAAAALAVVATWRFPFPSDVTGGSVGSCVKGEPCRIANSRNALQVRTLARTRSRNSGLVANGRYFLRSIFCALLLPLRNCQRDL